MSQNLERELSTLFEDHADRLKGQWVTEMRESGLLEQMSDVETEKRYTALYNTVVSTFRTGEFEDVGRYAKEITEEAVLRDMSVGRIIGGILKLRDIYARFIFSKYRDEKDKLYKLLDSYEPVANNILTIVTMAFVEERERVIQEQQRAMMGLSTPVLQIREEILVLPLIGTVDSERAEQILEKLLNGIVELEASVVIIDLTGVPVIDSLVANYMIKTVHAAKMLGADTIITGISPVNAQTLAGLGIDISMLITKNNLRAGLWHADQILGFKVIREKM